jgi:hypothetical protein
MIRLSTGTPSRPQASLVRTGTGSNKSPEFDDHTRIIPQCVVGGEMASIQTD